MKAIVENLVPDDSGPIYKKAVMGRLPVEPFIPLIIWLFLLLLFFLNKNL